MDKTTTSHQCFYYKIMDLKWMETAFYSGLLLFVLHMVYSYLIVLSVGLTLYMVYRMYVKQNRTVIDTGRKAILITGCDTGFGHHLAKNLALDGFTVFAGVLHMEGDGAKQLRSLRVKSLHVIKLDVTSDDDVRQTLSEVQSRKHGLWGIVNNAGFNIFGDVEHATIEQYKTCAEVNLYGPIRIIKAFLPLIRKSKGRIVNVSSVLGLYSRPGWSVYHIVKHGMETLTDSLRLEMTPFGVKVSVVEPGTYDGATSCRSPERIAFLKSEIDKQWDVADEEVRKAYGKDHFYKNVNMEYPATGTLSPKPVLDAIEDALFNVSPSPRYFVPGGFGVIDIPSELGRIRPYLPTWISDKLVLWNVG